jgi:flagellar motor protein MotB
MPISSQSLRSFSGKSLVRRSVIGILAFIVLLGLFGYFVLPGIVKSQAEEILSEKLHRQTTIGQVKINPYTLRATLHDFRIRERQGDATFASFDTLTVRISYQSLWRFAPVVRELILIKPYVHLVRQDANHYNVDDLLALANEPPKDKPAEPARFSLFNIQIDQGSIDFEDKPAGAGHTVTDLKIRLPFISSLPSQEKVYVQPLLSAKVNGAPLLIKGKARPFADPMEAVVDLNIDKLQLPAYLKYIPGTPHFKMPSGQLDVQMTASFRQPKNAAPRLALNGNVELSSLQINDEHGKSIARLPQLIVTLHEAQPFAQRFDIAKLRIDGIAADIARDAKGRLNVDNLLTPPAAAAQPVAPKEAKSSAAEKGFGIALAELDIRNAALRYKDGQTLEAGLDKLNLNAREIRFDSGKKTLSLAEVSSNSATLALEQGKRNSSAKVAAKARNADSGSPYVVTVAKVNIRDWAARIQDRSLKQPAVTTIGPFNLAMRDISTAPGARSQLDLNAAVNKNGQLAVKGEIGIVPLHADLALDLKNVDIMQAQPYFTDQVNILLTRANVSGKGHVKIDQAKNGELVGGYQGDLALGNVATVDKQRANSFLSWRTLSFGGMDVRLQPFSLNIDRVSADDFFARVIIDPTGRLNLQDVQRSEAGHKSVTEEQPTETKPVAKGNTKTAVLPEPAKPARNMPPIKIGKLVLSKGQVRFTDNFIKPNYTANLMDFGGTVSDLSSDPNGNANVDLKGVVNSAPLAVSGRVNPLKGDLSLDLHAEVHGMEMAPLSPYSGRYIGYGIEKGKLSFEVNYKVENRVLTAQNRLILEQLTLGEKVEGSRAGNLPVRFALSLLRDRNGVIDVNLPIGGSLDDPQFSIGGIIVKIFVNIITKAVTSPFSLISSMFGGGEELSYLAFDSGRARLSDKAADKLKTMAKALNDRPAIKLEITGRYDAQVDREGLKRAMIDRKVRALKLKDQVVRGESSDAGKLTVAPQEYPALLKRVYKDEKFKKPRNMIGMQKDIPVAEMEQLMIDNTTITDDDLVNLGNRRAQAAKDWLIADGHVPADRVSIVAAKPGTAKESEATPAARVDFSLK